jgi:hypothetical protein
MATFPTLTRAVSHRGWTESKLIDPTIRSEFVSGAIATRARFSGTIPVLYKVTYHHISAADKAALETFEDSIDVGVTSFNWTNILTSTMWKMRLNGPIQFGLEPNCIDKYYAQIEMFGAAGSSSSSSVSSSSSSSSSSLSSSSSSSSSSSA